MPRRGEPKIGALGCVVFFAALRACAAANNMLRDAVRDAICGTAAIENLSVSAA